MAEDPGVPAVVSDQDAELLRAFLAERDVACPGCGYNLRGLTGDACPECGNPVQLAVIVPVESHSATPPIERSMQLSCVVYTIFGSLWVLVLLAVVSPRQFAVLAMIAVPMVVILACVMWWWSWRSRQKASQVQAGSDGENESAADAGDHTAGGVSTCIARKAPVAAPLTRLRALAVAACIGQLLLIGYFVFIVHEYFIYRFVSSQFSTRSYYGARPSLMNQITWWTLAACVFGSAVLMILSLVMLIRAREQQAKARGVRFAAKTMFLLAVITPLLILALWLFD